MLRLIHTEPRLYSLEAAQRLDENDPIRDSRALFRIPKNSDGTDQVYLCGNSLGLQPVTAESYVYEVLDDWKTFGVEGHFRALHPWMNYHELLTDKMARIVGGLPEEVVCMNSLSVNLHLLMVSFYRPSGSRYKILVEERAFPSDRYAVASQVRFHGYDPDDAVVTFAPREGEDTLRLEDLDALLAREGSSIALILLGGVQYYSGQALDMQYIAGLGHRHGCVVGFDLAHAAGNIPLSLHDWDADFAAWCSYKYLNAGPGSTAGIFIHQRHLNDPSIPRFEGWWGTKKSTRFRMEPVFDPIAGAEAWQNSNPAILPMAALRASLEIFDSAGMDAIRAKSVKLTGYLRDLLVTKHTRRFSIITPAVPGERGCQLSIHVYDNGNAAFDVLHKAGIVCDWREPGIIRVAPAPLYNTFADVFAFASTFHSFFEP